LKKEDFKSRSDAIRLVLSQYEEKKKPGNSTKWYMNEVKKQKKILKN